jgi:hypothetical protein
LLFFPGKVLSFSFGFMGLECFLLIFSVMCLVNYYFGFLVLVVWLLIHIFVSWPLLIMKVSELSVWLVIKEPNELFGF